MSDEENPIFNKQIEAYLDGQMSPSEREAFEEQLRARPELAQRLELQQRIDSSLRRQFSPEEPSAVHLEQVLAGRSPGSAHTLPWRRVVQVALVAAAAAVAGVIAGWQFLDRPVEQPFFQPRPVAELYHEAVASGFEPYYECRDDARFAATFQKRQGIVLHLAAMPAGQGMLGLSYPGGLSRDTTAMLCLVDEKPVMVFVDRVENDQPNASKNEDPALTVHREARDGLVFYEVAPQGTPSVLEYLVSGEPQATP
jgi:hypothetical protein